MTNASQVHQRIANCAMAVGNHHQRRIFDYMKQLAAGYTAQFAGFTVDCLRVIPPAMSTVDPPVHPLFGERYDIVHQQAIAYQRRSRSPEAADILSDLELNLRNPSHQRFVICDNRRFRQLQVGASHNSHGWTMVDARFVEPFAENQHVSVDSQPFELLERWPAVYESHNDRRAYHTEGTSTRFTGSDRATYIVHATIDGMSVKMTLVETDRRMLSVMRMKARKSGAVDGPIDYLATDHQVAVALMIGLLCRRYGRYSSLHHMNMSHGVSRLSLFSVFGAANRHRVTDLPIFDASQPIEDIVQRLKTFADVYTSYLLIFNFSLIIIIN